MMNSSWEVPEYYLVLDLDTRTPNNKASNPHEIVEVSVVPYHIETNTIQKNRTFHYYCNNSTTGWRFIDIFHDLHAWLEVEKFTDKKTGKHNFIWITYGDWNLLKCLPNQCVLSSLKIPFHMLSWCNVKVGFWRYMRRKRSRKTTMDSMLRDLNISMTVEYNSGVDECMNICRVIQVLRGGGVIFRVTCMTNFY